MYSVFASNSASVGKLDRHDGSYRSSSGPPTKKTRTASGKDEAETGKLTRSCAECRRRRIRCDSTDPPCGQCQWYKVPELCHYPARRRRNVPSQESFTAVSTSLEKATKVIENLFASDSSLDLLSSLSRDELVALIASEAHESETESSEGHEEALQHLEPSCAHEFRFDESTRDRDMSTKISDDVNALSLSLDSSSSYLGISSIPAILRVMAYISPDFKALVQYQRGSVSQPDRVEPYSSRVFVNDEQTLIDTYFTYLHCITPLVDEAEFRGKYARGDDNSSPWLALLNMVLTMGSLATPEPDERTHLLYHAKASQHLSLESFGNGHLETVQALGLLGGWYCHYLNQPNMANVIMGAALRMAIAMGLHREPAPAAQVLPGSYDYLHQEVRRRIWWSLFCLDAWASFTLGRPSLGRWNSEAMTVQPPRSLSDNDYGAISLSTSVEFCKIGTAVQDQFARHPVITCRDVLAFDARLKKWHKDLPSMLQHSTTCPPNLLAARGLINARYRNLRLIIHRPRLLIATLKQTPPEELLSDELEIVDRCREIAGEVIREVQRDWFPIQQIVRNSVWFLFQGCLVSLLSLFSDPHHPHSPSWTQDVETSLLLLDEMSNWSLVVQRTREVVSTIFEAAKRHAESKRLGVLAQSGEMRSGEMSHGNGEMEIPTDFSWDAWNMDPIWNDMEWGSVPGFNGFSFDAADFGTLGNFG